MQPYVESLVLESNVKITATYDEAGRTPDAQYPIWIARIVYDYCAGLSWAASEAKHLRELRVALGLPIPLPPGPSPRTGRVRLSGRTMADDGGPWLPLGTTLFWAVREAGTPHLSDNLTWGRAQGLDCIRPLGEATDWAPDLRIDPRVPGWIDKLRVTRDEAMAVGLRLAWTIFGGNQLTPAEQLRAVEDLLVVCQERPESVQGVEISNEGNGFRDPDGGRRMRGFGEIFARHGYPTALTSWESWDPTLYPGSAATVGTEHFERAITDAHGNPYPDGYWRPVRQPWGYWEHTGVPPAFINGEPIGIGSSVVQDTDPLRLACAAVVTWLVGGALHIVHTGAGVYGVPTTHPVGGFRPANLWEQPTLEPTLQAIRAMRTLLPPDLPAWARQNHHWPGHPCTFAPNAPGEPSYPSQQGCVRAYAATRGPEWICLPIGVMGSFTMTPKQAGTWTSHDPLTGTAGMSGNGPIVLEAERLLRGRFA